MPRVGQAVVLHARERAARKPLRQHLLHVLLHVDGDGPAIVADDLHGENVVDLALVDDVPLAFEGSLELGIVRVGVDGVAVSV